MSASTSVSAVAVMLLVLELYGCSSSIYGWHVRTNSSPPVPSFNRAMLAQEPVTIFGGLAQPGLLGSEVGLDAILAQVLRTVAPHMNVIAPKDMLTRINTNGLADEYTRMRNDALQSAILSRDSLKKIGAAIGARYIFQPRLTAFTQAMTDRWSFTDIRISQTRSSIMRMSVQLWDADTGELLWASMAESSMQNEALAQDPIYFQDDARITLGGIISDLMNGKTGSVYTPLDGFLDQLVQIPQTPAKSDGGGPARSNSQ